MSIILLIILLMAFTIGLNIGLHGSLSMDSWGGKKETQTVKEPPTIRKVETQSNQLFKPPQQHISIPPEIKKELPTIPSSLDKMITLKPTTKPKPKTSAIGEKVEAIEKKVQVYVNALKEKQQTPPKSYQDIPVLLLTCNRHQLLDQTLNSLSSVDKLTKDKILIVQDGSMIQIADVARTHNIKLIQNTAGLHLRGGAGTDGASRIAQHYRFALTTAFNQFPNAPAIIIVEDDLFFSPDFYDYLTSVAPILDTDPTTFVVSAWNDNGFENKVKDPFALRRTEFFPGLGWLLTRKLYKTELEAKWPTEHWDHWLRSEEIHKNRETVHPQVPRTYHNGVKGTFMNEATHNKYFRHIAFNQDEEIHWKDHQGDFLTVISKAYELRIEEMIAACHHATSVNDLLRKREEIVCVWVDVPTNVDSYPPFEKVSTFFGIWHEFKRDNHRGLHEFYFQSNYVLLINIFNPQIHQRSDSYTYKHLKPNSVEPIAREEFNMDLLLNMPPEDLKSNVVKAKALNMNCDEVCAAEGKSCYAEELLGINNCDQLRAAFSCQRCIPSGGSEQPAYVDPNAEEAFLPGYCLFNKDFASIPITCGAKHPSTYRLCPCM